MAVGLSDIRLLNLESFATLSQFLPHFTLLAKASCIKVASEDESHRVLRLPGKFPLGQWISAQGMDINVWIR
jgi:hypothetical protein